MANHCIDCDYCEKDLRLEWNFYGSRCRNPGEALKCSLMTKKQKDELSKKLLEDEGVEYA